MKKISLSRETLRVLTAQETGNVAGGAVTMPQTRCATDCTNTDICETANCSATCYCTVGCTPQTQDCPPPTTNNPRARCACPDK